MTGDHRPLLSVRDLQVRFPVRTDRGKGVVQAVAGIDFDIHRGQTVSLVGESGSGKSTVANALMHLVEPSAGTVLLDGRDVTSVRGRELKALRRRIAMVFQDPFASLDPRQHVSRISSSRWASPAASSTGTRTSSRAGSASACPSPGRSRASRTSSSSTRRPRPWTSPSRRRS